MRSRSTSVVLLVAVALMGSAPPATAGSAACGWTIDGTVTRADMSLAAVTRISSTSVWAVGHRTDGPNKLKTVTLHWNGSSWRPVPSPNPNGNVDVFSGVSGTSDTDVWAVGTTGGAFPPGSLIEHWDGVAWTVFPAPAGVVGELTAVSADSPSDAWAVGNLDGTVAHWDGIVWSHVPTPRDTVTFSGVAAIAPTDVWAVGEDYAEHRRMVAMHWDGAAWAEFHLAAGQLDGVAAVASNDVWMVGNDLVNTAESRHWNGVRLPQYPLPDPGTEPWIDAVASLARGDVWAVGYHRMPDLSYRSLAYHLRGRTWGVVPTPDVLGQDEFLYGVAADPVTHRAWAVGTSEAPFAQFAALVLDYFPC